MSTRQTYDYTLEAAESARVAAAAQRRTAELARLRAERAAAIHAQAATLAAEKDRLRAAQLDRQRAAERATAIQSEVSALAGENDRVRSFQLDRQGAALAAHESQLAALSQRAQALGMTLDRLEDQTRTSGLALEAARTELNVEVDRLASLERAAGRHEQEVIAVLAAARQTLERVEAVQAANSASFDFLADAVSAGRGLAQSQSLLEEEIRQLEAECSFLGRQAGLAPIAMVTLEAMESNGYRLQSTLGQEEMVAYFEKEGLAHQIAVRVAPVARLAGEAQRWDVLAETFGMRDEGCLGELDDFETAVEEIGHGRLRRKEARVYPRDDSQAVLPKPPRRTLRRRAQEAGAGGRERA